MELCDIPSDQIPSVEIPTGLPLLFDAKHGRIRLFEDPSSATSPSSTPVNPLLTHEFGSKPELLFKYDAKLTSKPMIEWNEQEIQALRDHILIKS
jgi:hypothetical protein